MTVKVSLFATDFPIKSVKIFSCGEAEVTRIFPLDLTDCPNESLAIEIEKLPKLSALAPPVITAGSVDLPIVDYYHGDCRPTGLFGSPLNVSSDVLRDLNAKYTSLEDERQLRQKSFAFLSTYMDSLAQGKSLANEPGPAQLVKFFDEFVDLGKSRSEAIAVLDQQILDIEQAINEEIRRLQHERYSLTVTATIVLAPVTTNTVDAELELVYRVPIKGTTWKPIYEVHVTTIDGVPSPSVVLKYRCQIYQCTGEDWDDVELVVTTAQPGASSTRVGLPQPKKMVLVQKPPQPLSHFQPEVKATATSSWNIPGQGSAFANILSVQQHDSLFVRPNLFAPPAPSQASSRTLVDAPFTHLPTLNALLPSFGGGATTATSSQPIPSALQHPETFSFEPVPLSPHTNENSISLSGLGRDVTHTATSKVFIPSRMEVHHVLIATIPLKASFMRVAVPTVDSRAFYSCEITNTSNYVLPPGLLHTYLDGKHVSDSQIMDVSKPQTIQCSLGIDSAVTTEIERLTADSDAAHPFDTQRKTHTIKITVKNPHERSIGDLIVRASLPIPQTPRIAMSLREPIGLSMVNSDTVPVRDRCSVRWSTAGERAGPNGGVIEWVCRDVQPGSQVLKAVWDVTSPGGYDVVEQ